MLNSAYMRYAGETPLPEELDALRNLLLRGQLRDSTGSVTITPQGSFEARRSGSPWSVKGSAGIDPSIQLMYQSIKEPIRGTDPSNALDEALLRYSQTY